MTNPVTAPALEPLVVPPGDGRLKPLQLPGHEIVVKLPGAGTGGLFAAGILRARPMSGPPLHVHTREDEWFYVLKGEFVFRVGERRFAAGPGTSVFAPRNLPHAWQNFTAETVEALAVIAPPQLEGLFLEMSRMPLEPAALQTLVTRYGLSILGPPLS
jgi:mannose-6-phosphate isomerase-like protein (cupin superfamily)